MRSAAPLPRWLLVLPLLVLLPFVFVTIPPLVDVPGHLGQFAIQVAPPDSALRRYFSFHWALRLNLGTDGLVALLAPVLGLGRTVWLVTAAIPLLMAGGIVALARVANGRVSAGTSWALCFCYSYPFSYGFLNYCLTTALSLIAFACWIGLEHRRAARAALFLPATPILFVSHALGAVLLPLMVVARAAAGQPVRPIRAWLVAIVRDAWPLAGAVPIVLLWKLGGESSGLDTKWNLHSKINALIFALRDQDRALDLFSIVSIGVVLVVGRWLGARYSRRNGAVAAALALLFLLIPSELTGAWFTDTRLLPVAAVLALALQDWSAVDARQHRRVLLIGAALFAVRMGVTTAGFIAYQRSFDVERQALPHVAPGSRVLALVTRQCKPSRHWRMGRLDHLPALATADRDAWVNSHWDIGDIHLLRINYRPSPDFFDDPSQYVWPAACVRHQKPARDYEAWRNRRRTIEAVMPDLPLGGVDYLWLVDARLPPGAWSRRLRPVWSAGNSALYRVVSPGSAPPAA